MKKKKLSYSSTVFYDRTYFNGKGDKIKRSYTKSVIRGDKPVENRSYYTTFRGFISSEETKGFISQLLAVIVVLFLVITVIRVGRGMSISESVPTFTGFLETVVNAPVISPTLDVISVNFGSWFVEFQFLGETISLNFDFLRVVVESLLSVINFLLWLVQNLYLLLQYIFYFLRWVFQM